MVNISLVDLCNLGDSLESLGAFKFDGIEINYSDGEQYWREWYLSCDNVMLFITYNCDIEDEEAEDVIVDAILETLAISEE